MTSGLVLVAVSMLALAGWFMARARARALRARGSVLHSAVPFHGWHMALSILGPGLIVWAIWLTVQPALVGSAVAGTAAGPVSAFLSHAPIPQRALLTEAGILADHPGASPLHPEAEILVAPLRAARRHFAAIGAALALVAAFAGGAWGFTRVRPRFRARTQVERVGLAVLLAASLLAVLTAFGLAGSLLFGAGLFFRAVSPIAFLSGPYGAPAAQWSAGRSAVLPLLWGTVYIGAIIAMAVAIPVGVMSAIYLTQYASRPARRWIKPLLEILAGIPTVVYGYFAALSVGPVVRDLALALGMPHPSAQSALAAGLVMGVMIIPLVCAMTDSALAAVPRALCDGSLALGATRSETIRKVLLPAALPGIVAGVMLAISRALGETMIVVMVAGVGEGSGLSMNPFAPRVTVTSRIVRTLAGHLVLGSPMAQSAFALGLVLFLVTLALNAAALRVVRRFRRAYEHA